MFLAASAVCIVLILFFLFRIRTKDLPEPEPVSPYHHLELRKAAIYESLRDLQFEFRVGKLSDADYQRTKQELQGQLTVVLSEIDKVKAGEPQPKPVPKRNEPASADLGAKVCPHCSAKFDRVLKFCGECGKSMAGDAA
jgi:hypothetical protein